MTSEAERKLTDAAEKRRHVLRVLGLPRTATDDFIRGYALQYATPVHTWVATRDGECSGFGFVEFATDIDALKVLQHMSSVKSMLETKLLWEYVRETPI